MKTYQSSIAQRGAMFGLDARIALAIFGGLSIITGAALFTVMSEIGVTRRLTEMNNVGKAVQAYALDTAVYPATIERLLSDTPVGWNGPYLQIEDADAMNNNQLRSSTGDDMILHYRRDTAWANVMVAPGCNSTDPCGIYIQMLVDQAMGDKIDLRVDGVASPTTGNVRLHVLGAFYVMGYNIGFRR